MSTANFTQGEWWYDGYCYIFAKQPDGNTYPMIADFDTDEAYLARMRGVGAGLVENGEQAANAQLISAAPDLLAVVRRFVRIHIEMSSTSEAHEWEEEKLIDEARAAIAKATGETK